MAWNKLKSLFVVKDHPEVPDKSALEVSSSDLTAFELPKDPADPAAPAVAGAPVAPPPPGTPIDFQGLYDQAGIPNTDEVEALEKFLGGLDMELPQASKVAAAKAFLGAIGKSPNDVLEDAARKIQVVRIVDESKHDECNQIVAKHQADIDALQKQIEDHRTAMEAARKELESVKGQCAVEEGRLQGARTFFGHVGQVPPPAAPEPDPKGKKSK